MALVTENKQLREDNAELFRVLHEFTSRPQSVPPSSFVQVPGIRSRSLLHRELELNSIKRKREGIESRDN